MAVGKELESLTGIRLFHNHMSIEPVLNFFPFGHPSFGRIVNTFRDTLFREVAVSDLPGLCFTYVWDIDRTGDNVFVDKTCQLFEDAGANVSLVELRASLDERLRRNRTEDRIREKPSKRDLEESERRLLKLEEIHKMNSDGEVPSRHPHIVIENTHLSAREAANEIARQLDIELIQNLSTNK